MSTISLSISMDSAQSTANGSNISIQETVSFEGGEGSEHRVRSGEGRAVGLYAIERAVSVHVRSWRPNNFEDIWDWRVAARERCEKIAKK